MYNLGWMSQAWAETKAAGILPKVSEVKHVCVIQQHKQQDEKFLETVIEFCSRLRRLRVQSH